MVPKPVSKVPVTAANADICMCAKCPVQANSRCTIDKKASFKNAHRTRAEKGRVIPGLYCSTGVNNCLDIDFKQICICESCPVYIEYHLASRQPTIYFCRDGASR